MQRKQGSVYNEDIQLANTRTDDPSKWDPSHWKSWTQGILHPSGLYNTDRNGMQYSNQIPNMNLGDTPRSFVQNYANISNPSLAQSSYPEDRMVMLNKLTNAMPSSTPYNHAEFTQILNRGVSGGIVSRH
jgi:hypothetical protein